MRRSRAHSQNKPAQNTKPHNTKTKTTAVPIDRNRVASLETTSPLAQPARPWPKPSMSGRPDFSRSSFCRRWCRLLRHLRFYRDLWRRLRAWGERRELDRHQLLLSVHLDNLGMGRGEESKRGVIGVRKKLVYSTANGRFCVKSRQSTYISFPRQESPSSFRAAITIATTLRVCSTLPSLALGDSPLGPAGARGATRLPERLFLTARVDDAKPLETLQTAVLLLSLAIRRGRDVACMRVVLGCFLGIEG